MKEDSKDTRHRPDAAGSSRERTLLCPCCNQVVTFCWKCTCGFHICQVCMADNSWGMTCNHVTWTCPDCGKLRSY